MMLVIKTMQPATALAIARCDTNKYFFTAVAWSHVAMQ